MSQTGYSRANILKASALLGSGSAVSVITNVVRNKTIAILLGPSGMGVYGLLQAVMNATGALTGTGFSTSGVRHIAAANADANKQLVGVTWHAIRMLAFVMGILTALLLLIFRESISLITFGDLEHSTAIVLLSVAVICMSISGSQTALINGLYHLKDLTQVNIYSSLLGMLSGILAVWFLKERGIVVAVISPVVARLMVSWWFCRRIRILRPASTWKTIYEPLKAIVALGFVLMLAEILQFGTQFYTRILVTRSLDLPATGHFQAAWEISMGYLGFILGAMGADYYPRLTAIINDSKASIRKINEQVEVALLLSGPIILFMILFAPLLIELLYSKSFTDTASVLRWQVLGDIFKVASWPLGFAILAQGNGGLFLLVQVVWNLSYLFLVWLGLSMLGLSATGVAFLVAYFITFMVIWFILKRSLTFRWSGANKQYIGIVIIGGAIVFCTTIFKTNLSVAIGLIVSSIISFYFLKKLVGIFNNKI